MTGPPVQQLGAAVLLQGRGVEVAFLAAAATERVLTERGQPVPRGLPELTAALRAAVSPTRRSDVARDTDSARSDHDRITAHEAAKVLGVTTRSVQRLARTLDGRKVAGRWTFDRDLVAEYRALRDTH